MSGDPSLRRLAEAILVPPFPGTTVPDWLRAALGRGLAGVTLYGRNVAGPGQVAALTAQLRAAADEPVIAIDEEGGDVTRIAHQTGSPYPGNAALGAVDDTQLTREIYRQLGADLAGVGINFDLAPIADVNSAPDNPIIGTRSFGAGTDLVARHAAAAITGLQSAGIAACAKHFPGHGSTRDDSHHIMAMVDGDLDELRRRDLPPFIAAIEAGVRAIMPGHLLVPGLTGGLPATWSAAAVTGLLRGELGFTGVIITDALEMRAVSDPHGVPEAAVRTLAAGVDLLCLGNDQDEQSYLAVRDTLVAAVAEGRLPAGRLEEAGSRVAELRGWLRARGGAAGQAQVNGNGDGQAGLSVARRALRVFGLSSPLADPVVVELRTERNIAVGAVPWGLGPWLDGNVVRLDVGQDGPGQANAIANVLARAVGRPLVVVVRDAHRHQAAQDVTTELLAARPDAVVVEMGLPVWRPASGGYVATYGAAWPNGRAAAEVLGLA
ncbi:MAG TPA: glycoside hydrolase family 3 N-terminal domain-containing protein [Streptosporangiaceae bacterium]|nr:glycoside hydrolase family 3 N-terminal domain-containing protein [Streptosporangiaceae bacterium]